ncbi:Hypothetical predicted protein [Marmota monax]|uniref:Uncharacterized protein n=1 Tax=Marmota monax TaxID=9995 RepID=A0A5E4AZZ4_MARMO|nr:Hypothetical predicted protein [Marmota monax]
MDGLLPSPSHTADPPRQASAKKGSWSALTLFSYISYHSRPVPWGTAMAAILQDLVVTHLAMVQGTVLGEATPQDLVGTPLVMVQGTVLGEATPQDLVGTPLVMVQGIPLVHTTEETRKKDTR